jgi:hypothetical protein
MGRMAACSMNEFYATIDNFRGSNIFGMFPLEFRLRLDA